MGTPVTFDDIRNSSGRTGVDLNNVNLVVVNNILDIYQTDYVKSHCQTSCIFNDSLSYSLCKSKCGIYGDTVAGVNTCTLNVLHDSGDKEVRTVADSIYLDLRAHHVLIDQHRIFKSGSGDDTPCTR